FHGSGALNQGNGILVQAASRVFVSGNFLGTDSTGNTALGNDRGVFAAAPATVGGTTPGDRNVISGNNLQGIQLFVGGGNVVQGNFIGTSSSGKSAVPNGGDGILVSNSNGNVIGATGGAGNVISGNKTNGINLLNAVSTTIQGNLIGTDVSGAVAVGNQQ